MKKILLILLTLFLTLSLSGCLKKESEIEIDNKIEITSNNITIFEGTFKIHNHSDNEYYYSPEFALEIEQADKWVMIETEEPLSWDAVLYVLKGNEEIDFEANFEFTYGLLSEGKYRLQKSFKNKNNSKEETVYIEFEVIDNREVLSLVDFRNNPVGLHFEPDDLIGLKHINIPHKELQERSNVNYCNDSDLKTLVSYIKDEFGLDIDDKWKVHIHYYNSDKTAGMVEFQYFVNEINTNKSVMFNINGNQFDQVFYKCLFDEFDESELIDRINKFERKYVQGKRKLEKDESFFEEQTSYTYYININKLVYSYTFFFKTKDGFISNDYGTVCLIEKDGSAILLPIVYKNNA